jgi:GT2 family glycosyltransferase
MTDYPDYEIIIVDNGSTDPETLAYYLSLSKDPTIQVVEFNQPFNYSQAINIGAAHSCGKYLLFLNNDIQIIAREWLAELVQWAMLPQVGVVGAKLMYPDNTIQHAGVVFDPTYMISHVFCHQAASTSGPHGSVDWYRNYLAVTGACQMIRKDLFNMVGGYDENFGLTFNDVDICLRLLRQGYRTVYNPFSVSIHWESATRTDRNPAKDILRAFSNFEHELISGDPYFSEQLVDAFDPHLRTIEPERNIILPLRVNQMAVRLRQE